MQVVALDYCSRRGFHRFFSHIAFILVTNTIQCPLSKVLSLKSILQISFKKAWATIPDFRKNKFIIIFYCSSDSCKSVNILLLLLKNQKNQNSGRLSICDKLCFVTSSYVQSLTWETVGHIILSCFGSNLLSNLSSQVLNSSCSFPWGNSVHRPRTEWRRCDWSHRARCLKMYWHL